MKNKFLSEYADSSLIIKNKSQNLFWVNIALIVSFGLLALNLQDRIILVQLSGAASVILVFSQFLLVRGKFSGSSFLTIFILTAAASGASLTNRYGFLAGDIFQIIVFFSIALTVTNSIAKFGFIGVLVTITGFGIMYHVTTSPIDPALTSRTISDANESVSSLALLVLFGISSLIGLFNIYQYLFVLKRIEKSSQTIEEQNTNLSLRIIERTQEIRNLMDNSGQGFLSFGPDFLVHPEFSRGCLEIVGKSPAGKRVETILFPYGGETSEEFVQGLELFFQGKTKSSVIFDLLETEIFISGKYITIDYRELAEKKILCILTDITSEKKLEERNRQEAERQRIIFRAINHKLFFAGFISEANKLFDSLQGYEKNPPNEEQINSFLRHLHTFKGNAGFFNFQMTQEVAHDFEFAISDSLVLEEEIPFREFTLDLKKAYYHEIRIIEDSMGKNWIEEAEGVVIHRNEYSKVSKYIRNKFPQEKTIINFLEYHRKIPLRELFSRFPYIADVTAEKLGKTIKPLILSGGEFRVLPEQYEDLVESCVHLVNNMVDHGIEYSYEREAIQKDPAGLLEISIEKTGDSILLIFRDDGKGISTSDIERRAKDSGILQAQESLSPQELLGLLFRDNFSTRNEASQISGRGIGLAAVKETVERMEGTITINSKVGNGTEFQIIIPLTKGRKKPNAPRSAVVSSLPALS